MKPAISIPRIPPPDRSSFRKKYVRAGKPVVIQGLTKDWPAHKTWNHAYLSQTYGHENISVIALETDGKIKTDVDTGVQLGVMPLRKAVNYNEPASEMQNWAITHSGHELPQQMSRDFHAPEYCREGSNLNSRIIISPCDTVTPLHQDLPENLFTIVRGRKSITLFAPSEPVYPHSRFSRLPNYAQVDIEHPDYDRFPLFRDAQPYTVDLEEGETLFIPSFWWHHLRHMEPSISVTFWWSQGWLVPVSWAASVYTRARKIGNQNTSQ